MYIQVGEIDEGMNQRGPCQATADNGDSDGGIHGAAWVLVLTFLHVEGCDPHIGQRRQRREGEG